MVAIGLLYAAALNATFLLLMRAIPLWPLFFLVGLVEVTIYVPAIALLHRGLGRDERIFATGSHSYAFSAGFFLGPVFAGLLLPPGGYGLMFGMLTAVTLAALAVVSGAGVRSAA